EPYCRPYSLVGLVFPEREELRKQPTELRNDRLPLCVVVRPQNGVRMHDIVRVVLRRNLQRAKEGLYDCVAGNIHGRHLAEPYLPSARAASLAARFSARVR